MSAFGECLDCGGGVERVGWDDLCFACQEAELSETCPDCDGDGYIDLLDDFGGVIGPGPCPRGCHPASPAVSVPEGGRGE